MPRRLTSVILALVVAACTPTKGVSNPVKSVKVSGNKAYGDKTIVSRLAMRPPQGLVIRKAQAYDPLALRLDRRRVEAFYHERGYFDAQVNDVKTVKDGKWIRITIDVQEGAPTRIAALEVTGTEADFARGVIEHQTTMRAGSIFDHPEYLLAKDTLEQALVEEGYAHAVVEGQVEVDRPAHRAVVRLRADPGPLVHFGKLKVEGNNRVPEDAIRNRVAWDEGDVFDPKKIRKTEGRLYQLGVLSSVRTDWTRDGRPPIVDVTIKVAEGARHEIRLGFGAGVDRSRWELRTRAGFTQHRFLDSPLTTFRADVTPGYSWLRSENTSGPSIEAVATIDREDLVIPRLKGTLLGSYQREPREGYTLAGPRVNLSLQRTLLTDDLMLHAGWELRYLSFTNYDPMVFGPAATRSRLAYYEQQAVFDSRDAPLDARRGVYLAFTINEGGPFAGGTETFLKVMGEARSYLAILPRLVAAGRLSAGRLTASGAETPLPMRFYGGGATDHRGFGFRRLAPARADAEGDLVPLGGDEMFLGSIETRLDVAKLAKQWLSTAIFLDAGDVTSAPGAIDLGNLHWAVGLGLRYNTIIGPIRADVGIRLNRMGPMDPDPGSRFAFHLSLGEAF